MDVEELINTVICSLPFVICAFGISMLVVILLKLNRYFILYYGIGGLVVVAVVYFLSCVFTGQK